MPLYRKIFKQAFSIAWNNKYLWFFGLFAALFIDNSGFELFLQIAGNEPSSLFNGFREVANTGLFTTSGLSNMFSLIATRPLFGITALLILLFILFLIIFLIWLVIVSQVAIVNNSAVLMSSRKKIGFQDGILEGNRKFWPILGLNALAFAVMALPIILESFNPSKIIPSAFYFFLFFLLILVVLVLSFIIKFAIAFLVIKKYDFKTSLAKGWDLFAKNWLISIEMALILFFIGLVGYFSIRFIFLPLLIIVSLFAAFLLFSLLSFSGLFSFIVFWIVYLGGYIASFILIILFGAFLATFQIVSWTKLFIELTGKGGQSKIVRMVENIKNK